MTALFYIRHNRRPRKLKLYSAAILAGRQHYVLPTNMPYYEKYAAWRKIVDVIYTRRFIHREKFHHGDGLSPERFSRYLYLAGYEHD